MSRILPQIVGEYPQMDRIPSGLFSYDLATGGGTPHRTMIEIYGYPGMGKSTLSYYLSGTIAKAKEGSISIADFETLDPEYVQRAVGQSGYEGEVHLAALTRGTGKKSREASGEEVLDELLYKLRETNVVCSVLDSVGALPITAEIEGSVADANVGGRAKVMAKFARSVVFKLRTKEKPANVLLTNHVHQIIGGRGTVTSGGQVIKHLCGLRFRLSNRTQHNDGSMTVMGKIEKLRYGVKDSPQTFQVFIQREQGIHVGLTAVEDCIALGAAKRERTVSLNDKSYGYFSRLIDNADDEELFEPFIKALKEYSQ